MILYQYDRFGAFVRSATARPNPEEPDKALIPAQATEISPLVVGPREVPVFDPLIQEWRAEPDFRGPVFNVETQQAEQRIEPGPLPDNLASSLPPSPHHVWDSATQAWKLDEASRLREAISDRSNAVRGIAVTRIQVHVSRARSFHDAELIYDALREIVVTAGAPARHDSGKKIYDYAAAKVAELEAETDLAVVEAYDPAADPDFPS